MNRHSGAVFSLHPRHAARIYDGCKTAEFRRVRVALDTPLTMWIYETAPTSEVTGHVQIVSATRGTPREMALLEPDPAERRLVADYLDGAAVATALHLASPCRLDLPVPVTSLGLSRAPRSYAILRA